MLFSLALSLVLAKEIFLMQLPDDKQKQDQKTDIELDMWPDIFAWKKKKNKPSSVANLRRNKWCVHT